jgi:toxin ParE1/3/4
VRLEWSPLAVADRASIFDYIAPENVDAAVALDGLFQQKAALVGAHPEGGQLGRVRGVREFITHRHYVLVYDTDPDRVRILRVLHTSRQWPPPRPMPEVQKRQKSAQPRKARGK